MVLVRANPYFQLKKDNHCSLSNNCWKIESWRILMWSTSHQGMMPYWGFRVSLCFWQLEQLAAAATGSVVVRSPTLQPAHGFPLGSAMCMILTKPWMVMDRGWLLATGQVKLSSWLASTTDALWWALSWSAEIVMLSWGVVVWWQSTFS